jgi:radical SAM superfamily enzyme YgiQ (UPF0313 family)
MTGKPIAVLLIATYELGRQPFGMASAAAWLRNAGAAVTCLDLAVDQPRDDLIAAADLVAFHVPMHTATRLAAAIVPRVRTVNAHAHLCFFGLYAPMNERYLRGLGAHTILGGEFESGLAALAVRLQERGEQGIPAARSPLSGDRHLLAVRLQERGDHGAPAAQSRQNRHQQPPATQLPGHAPQPEPVISLARQDFLLLDRTGLPELARYAYLDLGHGEQRAAGYTEASRGCKHRCRHCPVVPVYGGVFRVVQAEIVLQDIAQQVAAGARHISFGDPDFFNGPGHARRVVEALHQQFPDLTYDVTIKIEHLLKHAGLLPLLRDTGCLLITSAVEAVDDTILAIFDKHHTRADFARAVALCREVGITLNPTFVTFTPWTTLQGYSDLLAMIQELDLVENIAPIQYAIRLLIPEGSLLLELPEIQQLVGAFDQPALYYPWQHPDQRVDDLYQAVREAVRQGSAAGSARQAVFDQILALARAAEAAPTRDRTARARQQPLLSVTGRPAEAMAPSIVWPLPAAAPSKRRDSPAVSAPIPRLSEAWYC